jgi:hypothetical protein
MNIPKYEDYCKNVIIENLPKFEGQYKYCENLSYPIVREALTTSNIFHDHKAKEYVMAWFDEGADAFDHQIEMTAYGGEITNPFKNPEIWVIFMISEGINNLLNQCDSVKCTFGDGENLTKVTKELINKIIEDVKGKLL